ncbi:hypothetical protein MUN78_16535 [Leucobacter allii]|uniref:Phage protein n=1 Tax=Leucobacter allii TaxID=2932247 RepID=A0ABY4FLU9_9MICO|nr:hypothetical protein [Leucobacter allii]UOQ57238.1 hypothetical protein MUN78_16535 [Leucobacter allii]
MTTRRDLNELAALGSRTVELARAELEAFFYGLDLTRPELARDALIEFMPMLAQEYGDAAATAAAEWYEAQRRGQIAGSYSAVLGEGASAEQVAGTTRWAAGQLFDGDPSQTLLLLGEALQRFVLQGARDTVAANASRDPARPRFARVPMGRKTCAWCSMLASRGFVYWSEETAGIARGHFHDGCDCQVVSSFAKGRIRIDGYDPEALYERYSAARVEVVSEGIVPSDEAIAKRMRDMFPDEFTDGAEVPSLLREPDAGWPSSFGPVSPGRWRHILGRHGAGGAAVDTFPDGLSPYEIAKIIRAVVSNPDFTRPHPSMSGYILNYFKREDGRLYVVGTKVAGDGKVMVRTAFPPGEGTGIL